MEVMAEISEYTLIFDSEVPERTKDRKNRFYVISHNRIKSLTFSSLSYKM